MTSYLRFANLGNKTRTFWVGYSVQDSSGRWYDVPAQPVELGAGEESGLQETSWNVSEVDAPVSGAYKIKMSVWDRKPDESGAERLATAERADSFLVFYFAEDFESPRSDRWGVTSKIEKKLGRSFLRPENVSIEDGRLGIKLSSDTLSGGEIKSRSLYQYGSYRARIKVADAPSSLTGFFLYKEPDLENELDIEIFNDPSGRVMFTTYSDGKETNNVEKKLPFDPTEDF
ncbi:MAG: family 16 glycosylhydrolase, partial [Rubrobacteraceae bacterium]